MKIAFLQGHGELSEIEVADLSHSVMQDAYALSEYYEIEITLEELAAYLFDNLNLP